MKKRQKLLRTKKLGPLPYCVSKVGTKPDKKRSNNTKRSEFKLKLIEQQRFRKNFLLTKRQLRLLIKNSKQNTVFQNLFFRLDLILYSMFPEFGTLRAIRQEIVHGRVYVNNTREYRPNFICDKKDMISWKPKGGKVSNPVTSQSESFSINIKKLFENL